MANNKGVTDEKIIAALLNNNSLKDTAKAVGLSERALYDRMNEGEFIALYRAAKADLLRGAVNRLNTQIQAAIDTIAEIMTDKENSPAIRLQAAHSILNHAGKFAQRLQNTEKSIVDQIESNEIDFPISQFRRRLEGE